MVVILILLLSPTLSTKDLIPGKFKRSKDWPCSNKANNHRKEVPEQEKESINFKDHAY